MTTPTDPRADAHEGAGRSVVARVAPTLGAFTLAAVLGASGAVFTSTNYRVGAPGAVGVLIALWQVVPLLIAVRRPLVAWCVYAPTLVVAPLLVTPVDPSEPWPLLPPALIAYLVIQILLAWRRPLYVAAAAWALACAAFVVMAQTGDDVLATGPDVTLFVLTSALALVAGVGLRIRTRMRSRLLAEERLSAEERARRTLLEERARIAREMHDIVAHHMSVIVVQASTAEYRLSGLPPAAKEEFGSIAAAARESLTEMRRLLRVLREDRPAEDSAAETAPAESGTAEGAPSPADTRDATGSTRSTRSPSSPRTPQPGLARIPSLVESTRRAGTPVRLSMTAIPEQVPDVLALTAYRIVQEALSNVVRHASGASTRVSVDIVGSDLVVRVANAAGGPGRPGSPPVEAPVEALAETARAGHGLLGMRERVGLAGGELAAGPAPDGGFVVRASLPLGAGRPLVASGPAVPSGPGQGEER
ncbi:histidine kinase [Actinopolymorpha sp. NPDC004070]|uniref:sensor histidine kinase n=1 Tax=Actinopolymorpha sp. NPDC004070 TaxID=3154548 RepID=UPI0033B01AF7